MTFLHLSLLAGLAAIAVPIGLHLFGQQQPQQLDFPTLRFVRETRMEQSSSWQLRHFLLLLLRILLFAFIALALARPRVHSALLGSVVGMTSLGVLATIATVVAAIAFVTRRPKSVAWTAAAVALALWFGSVSWAVQSLVSGPAVPSSDQTAPIAAALIVDNGPTMAYRTDNQTRLEAAKEMAGWVLEQLPKDSRVGVLGGAPIGSLTLDPATAKSQVQLMEVRGSHVDLSSRVRTALELVLANELDRKEIYVFTDLAATGWDSSQSDLKQMLVANKDSVLVQIIDVGVQEHQNWQLGDVLVDYENVAEGGDVTFQVAVEQRGDKSDLPATVELLQQTVDPRLPVLVSGDLQLPPTRVVDRQTVELSSDGKVNLSFAAKSLEAGTHHFAIRLDRQDPLAIDNERFVTITSSPAPPMLVVADDPGIARMLALIANPQTTESASPVETIRYSQLSQADLPKYAAICMFDPPLLSDVAVERVKASVNSGAGLLLILGASIGSDAAANSNALSKLMPGKLVGPIQRDPKLRNAFLVPIAVTHPVFRELPPDSDVALWNLFPIHTNWGFTDLSQSTAIIADMSDSSSLSAPDQAVLSHRIGAGQVITITTPVPETESPGKPLWNELWVAADPYPAFAILVGSMRSLSGASQTKVNFNVGERVSLPNDTSQWPSRYDLFTPEAQTRPVVSIDGLLSLGEFSQPGTYYLKGQRERPVARGFSANVSAADTSLVRASEADLVSQLGEDAFRVAKSRDEVQSSIGQSRFGRELYPLVMLLVAGVFLAEQAMSNRFYQLKLQRAKG